MAWVSKQGYIRSPASSAGVLAKAMSTLPERSSPSTLWLRPDTIWMWMAGCRLWNVSRYGSRNWLVTVSLAPMVSCPICNSRVWLSFSSPVSSRPMALRTYSYSICPSAVSVTPRLFRANRRVCRSRSSCLMDWLTADWEIYSACAAAVMLPTSATSLKTRYSSSFTDIKTASY